MESLSLKAAASSGPRSLDLKRLLKGLLYGLGSLSWVDGLILLIGKNKGESMVEMFEEPKCANCPMRLKAEEKPNSLVARFWRWHTGWCPGWKAIRSTLAEKGEG